MFATAWAGPGRVLAVVLKPGCCGLGGAVPSAARVSSSSARKGAFARCASISSAAVTEARGRSQRSGTPGSRPDADRRAPPDGPQHRSSGERCSPRGRNAARLVLLWDSRAQRISGSGLTGYSLDGTRCFHVFGDDPISGVLPLDDRILVGGAAGSRVFRLGALLDGRTGRELRRVPFTVTLLAGDSPFWY